MFPLFLYMATVMVHSPNATMFFYSCPNQGQVISFEQDTNGIIWYQVHFSCKGLPVTTRLNQANLRLVGK